MKVVCKKLLVSLILVVTIFNFIFGNNISYASTDEGFAEEFINFITSAMGGIVSIMMWPMRIKATSAAFIANELILKTLAQADGGSLGAFETVTPYHIFFNKIAITDINFFNFTDAGQTSLKFRNEVAKWYYSVRIIAVLALLVVLVYVGIRMTISTIAEDKAKYKKMFMDWFMSIALLFVMQYIILFIIEVNNVIVLALESAVEDLNLDDAISSIAWNSIIGIGINSITSTLVYVGIMIYTLAFLIAYINRMLKIGFLIIISPLITITYALDKMKDNKSQALDTWFKEIIYTILIQPFHCIIYLAYISVCFDLIISPVSGGLGDIIGNSTEYNQLANGVLAIFCLLFIKQAEKIVRKIFGFKDDDEKTSFGAGLAATMVAAKTIPQAGAAARKFAGKVGNLQIMSKMKSDINLFTKNSKTLQKASNALNSSKAFNSMKSTVLKAQQKVNEATKKANKMIKGVKSKIENRPTILKSIDKKLTDYAKDPNNSRLKRKIAAKTQNVVKSIRNANTWSGAAKLSSAAIYGVATGGDIGQTANLTSATSKAIDNFNQGSASDAAADLKDAEGYQEEAREIRDEDQGKNEDTDKASGVKDGLDGIQEKLTAAEAKTKEARKKYKQNKTPENKAALVEAMRRENEIRSTLLNRQNRRTRTASARAVTADRFNNIIKKGDKKEYAAGSQQDVTKKSKVTNAYKGFIAQAVKNGDITQAEGDELLAKLEANMATVFNDIRSKAGVTNEFNASKIHAMVQQKIAPLISHLPSYERVVDDMFKNLEDYRGYCDDGFMYQRLSTYVKNGGSMDKLIDQMYEPED